MIEIAKNQNINKKIDNNDNLPHKISHRALLDKLSQSQFHYPQHRPGFYPFLPYSIKLQRSNLKENPIEVQKLSHFHGHKKFINM